MRRRRVVNLLLCIFFSTLVGTGIVLFLAPFLGMGSFLEELALWRLVHRQACVWVFILICIHLYFNRKVLFSYLRRARVRTILVFTLSAAALVCFAVLGILTTLDG